jgi:cytoskeletal protein CcmA (bactofilin family)
MWTKQPQAEVPDSSPSQGSGFPSERLSATATVRPTRPTARNLACLGSTLKVKGIISGDEDLQIDGKVEGPISLQGHRLTVGRTAQLSSEVTAREVVVYGKIAGNLRVRDRVDLKKDGEVIGDITTARISIEDGACFKGRIEIELAKAPAQVDLARVGVSVDAAAN